MSESPYMGGGGFGPCHPHTTHPVFGLLSFLLLHHPLTQSPVSLYIPPPSLLPLLFSLLNPSPLGVVEVYHQEGCATVCANQCWNKFWNPKNYDVVKICFNVFQKRLRLTWNGVDARGLRRLQLLLTRCVKQHDAVTLTRHKKDTCPALMVVADHC